MNIAVTFFRKKLDNKNKEKLNKNLSNESIFGTNSFIPIYMGLVSFVLLVILNINKLLFLGSNFNSFTDYINIENILSLNGIYNRSSYILEKIDEEDEKEKIRQIAIDENNREEFIAMDELLNEKSELPVFGKVKEDDVYIISENNTYQKISVCGVEIVNYSDNRNIDFVGILNSPKKEFLKSTDEIIMYTTHTSESYSNDESHVFEYSSPRRSLDGKYNMLNIASVFARNLNARGINTICSLNPHDYGEYNSAYMNSRQTLINLVNSNTNAKIAIDVHRDAIEDLEYAPQVNLKGYDVAQLMLVMGIGYEGENNPYMMDNLRLALELQILGNKIYPGLFKPMIIRNSVYNQDIIPNSFLIEVGASGNTIDQAEIGTRCLANLINLLFKD